jgi:hypothetical protein
MSIHKQETAKALVKKEGLSTLRMSLARGKILSTETLKFGVSYKQL